MRNPIGWLHVDIFRFRCFRSFEAYSIDSSKMIGGKSPELQPVHVQLTAGSLPGSAWEH